MNKTKIEWCDMTWNPVTGCLHGCEYCYARRISRRFDRLCSENSTCHESGEFYKRIAPLGYEKKYYPSGFDPTFFGHRLDEPIKIKTSQNIFVCSMADLFGDWVPDEWIKQVFEACTKAPWHRYLFLTKNPKRYRELYDEKKFPYAENYWFGTSCTKPSDEFTWFKNTPYKCFASIEPLLEPFGVLDSDVLLDWIIIGRETGNRKDKIIPKKEWIENIVNYCREKNVPVFMKNNLKDIWQEPLIQEYPWRNK